MNIVKFGKGNQDGDHDAAPTRYSRLLLVTVVGVVFALAVAGIGGSYAWLNASTTSGGGTVQAGTIGLAVNNASSASLGDWALSPATPVAKPVKVSNTGDVDLSLTASITLTTVASVASVTKARLTPVANAAACATQLNGTPGAISGYTTAAGFDTLAVGQTKWYCLELFIPQGTSATTSGQSLAFSLTFTGEQR